MYNFYNILLNKNIYLILSLKNLLNNITVNEGQDACLTFKFSGKPKPSIKWFKEEIEIDISIDESFEFNLNEDSCTLILKQVKVEDAGNYFAQLSNEVATINSNKANLVVNSMLNMNVLLKCFFLF